MENFTYFTPTKVFFGKDAEGQVGEIVKSYGFERVMLHYGGGSVKKTGLYDRVVASLKQQGISIFPFGGAQPNPKVSLVREGARLCKEQGVDLVLAVGGGSVIDSAKVIAIAAKYDCDPWEFSAKKVIPNRSLPVGTILTLAASGSEMSSSAVLTNEETGLKRGFNSDENRPLFSILNPELTYTVSPYQTACGIVDIMMHTLERYFSRSGAVDLTDRVAEGLVKSVIAAGKRAMENPRDYEARAALMWAGSLSHNDLTSCGREMVLVVHQLEHELSGMYDRIAHGAGLAVLFPAWMKYIYQYNIPRFCQYAVRIWDCDMDFAHPENTAMAGIAATEQFFRSLGMPPRLSELDVGVEGIDEMAEKCTFFGTRTIADYIDLGKQEIKDIFTLAL